MKVYLLSLTDSSPYDYPYGIYRSLNGAMKAAFRYYKNHINGRAKGIDWVKRGSWSIEYHSSNITQHHGFMIREMNMR